MKVCPAAWWMREGPAVQNSWPTRRPRAASRWREGACRSGLSFPARTALAGGSPGTRSMALCDHPRKGPSWCVGDLLTLAPLSS